MATPSKCSALIKIRSYEYRQCSYNAKEGKYCSRHANKPQSWPCVKCGDSSRPKPVGYYYIMDQLADNWCKECYRKFQCPSCWINKHDDYSDDEEDTHSCDEFHWDTEDNGCGAPLAAVGVVKHQSNLNRRAERLKRRKKKYNSYIKIQSVFRMYLQRKIFLEIMSLKPDGSGYKQAKDEYESLS